MICPHSSIEVSKENMLFPFGDTPYGYINVLIKPIFELRCGVKGEDIHATKSDRPIRGVEPESYLHVSTIFGSGFLIAMPMSCSLMFSGPFLAR